MPKDSVNRQTSPSPGGARPPRGGFQPIKPFGDQLRERARERDSTKSRVKPKAVKPRKSRRPKTSKHKTSKKDSTQSRKKTQAQDRLFKLVSGGVELPMARAMVQEEFEYKSNSTITKWFADDPKFYERILITEMAVAGRLQEAEMKAAQGGFLVALSIKRKKRWHKDGSPAETTTERSRHIAPPDIRAIGRSLDRRIPRLRKAVGRKGKELQEALNEVMPVVPVDEEGRPLVPFSSLCVTFGSEKVEATPKGKEEDADDHND